MTNVVRDTEIQTLVVEAKRVLVVDQERVRVVTVGVQGPPGPPSAVLVPPGAEGAVIYKAGGVAAADAAHFSYDQVTQALSVTNIMNATMDGGNF